MKTNKVYTVSEWGNGYAVIAPEGFAFAFGSKEFCEKEAAYWTANNGVIKV